MVLRDNQIQSLCSSESGATTGPRNRIKNLPGVMKYALTNPALSASIMGMSTFLCIADFGIAFNFSTSRSL